jgi:GTP cyclohydrolase I
MTQPKSPIQASPAATMPVHSPEDLQAVRRLLAYIGEDPDREGLLETPARFLKAWEEYTRGYRMNPEEILKSFEDGAQRVDEMVIVRDIPVYSLCEHHLAPFFGKAYVGYVPDKRILGLSKISRLVEIYGRRLQVQERLTNQIADALDTHLKPLGVAVVIECRHMCMESRGVRHTGTATVTSALRGNIKTNADTRREFLSLIGR